MHVIKLTVEYESYYSSIKEHMFLPQFINGVIVDKWKEGRQREVVRVGEVDGKHSECYGDLIVEFINLDEIHPVERTKMLLNTNYEQFESYFEEKEIDFVDKMEQAGHHGKMQLDLQKDLLEKEGISWSGGPMAKVWEKNLMKRLDEKYMVQFEEIYVDKEDLERALEILKANGIETHQVEEE